jgi:hypothetical protein
MTNAELLTYAAGKAYGQQPGRMRTWDTDDQLALDALAEVGVRTVERLGPERAAYWWWRGYNLTARKAPLILPES